MYAQFLSNRIRLVSPFQYSETVIIHLRYARKSTSTDSTYSGFDWLGRWRYHAPRPNYCHHNRKLCNWSLEWNKSPYPFSSRLAKNAWKNASQTQTDLEFQEECVRLSIRRSSGLTSSGFILCISTGSSGGKAPFRHEIKIYINLNNDKHR